LRIIAAGAIPGATLDERLSKRGRYAIALQLPADWAAMH
jgi:hypothetical protein